MKRLSTKLSTNITAKQEKVNNISIKDIEFCIGIEI